MAQDTFADTLEEVTAHFVLATESLSDSMLPGDDADILYSVGEAKTIVDTTVKMLRNAVVDNGGGAQVVAHVFLLYCPELNTALGKCASLLPASDQANRDLTKMALFFSEVHDEIQVIAVKTRAAIVLQSTWRGVLERRKYRKMIKGFTRLQRRFRSNRSNVHQTPPATDNSELKPEVWQEDPGSKTKFENELQALVEKRLREERVFKQIADTHPSKFFSMTAYCHSGRVTSIDTTGDLGEHTDTTEDAGKTVRIVESAALKIQYAVRRWLHKTSNNCSTSQWTRSLLQHRISDSRAAELQQEIETWQYRNKIRSGLSFEELMELSQRAQFGFARYNQSVMRRRINMHKTLSKMAQVKAINATLLEDAPQKLDEYNSQVHASKFHSLPLCIATKARMDHNAALKRLALPRIMQILADFD